jgi:hypothetical protein
MSSASLRCLLARVGLAACLASCALACRPDDLKKLELPTAGFRMVYDLDPGAEYQGHLRIGNTRTIVAEGVVATTVLNQSLECDVTLQVLGADVQRGGTLVEASFENVDLAWKLAPNTPVPEEQFIRDAIERVQGMNVSFNVLPTGAITYMPVPPQELPVELQQVIDQLLRGLEDAFLLVPKHAVDDGEHWDEAEHRGRKGKLGRYIEGTISTRVDGMYHHEALDHDVLRLLVDERRKETFTTEVGVRQLETEGTKVVLFSTDGYLVEVEGESRDFEPSGTTSFRKLRLEWKKTAEGTPGGPPASQTQTISDPCDPDYVGEEWCGDAPLVPSPTPREPPPREPEPPPETVPAPQGEPRTGDQP